MVKPLRTTVLEPIPNQYIYISEPPPPQQKKEDPLENQTQYTKRQAHHIA